MLATLPDWARKAERSFGEAICWISWQTDPRRLVAMTLPVLLGLSLLWLLVRNGEFTIWHVLLLIVGFSSLAVIAKLVGFAVSRQNKVLGIDPTVRVDECVVFRRGVAFGPDSEMQLAFDQIGAMEHALESAEAATDRLLYFYLSDGRTIKLDLTNAPNVRVQALATELTKRTGKEISGPTIAMA